MSKFFCTWCKRSCENSELLMRRQYTPKARENIKSNCKMCFPDLNYDWDDLVSKFPHLFCGKCNYIMVKVLTKFEDFKTTNKKIEAFSLGKSVEENPVTSLGQTNNQNDVPENRESVCIFCQVLYRKFTDGNFSLEKFIKFMNLVNSHQQVHKVQFTENFKFEEQSIPFCPVCYKRIKQLESDINTANSIQKTVESLKSEFIRLINKYSSSAKSQDSTRNSKFSVAESVKPHQDNPSSSKGINSITNRNTPQKHIMENENVNNNCATVKNVSMNSKKVPEVIDLADSSEEEESKGNSIIGRKRHCAEETENECSKRFAPAIPESTLSPTEIPSTINTEDIRSIAEKFVMALKRVSPQKSPIILPNDTDEGNLVVIQKESPPKSEIVLLSDSDEGDVVVVPKEFSPKSRIVLPSDSDEGDVLIVQKEFSPKSRIVLPSDTDEGDVVVVQKESPPKSQIVLPSDFDEGNVVVIQKEFSPKSQIVLPSDSDEGDVVIVQKEFSPKSRIVLPSDTDEGDVVVVPKESPPKSRIVLPSDSDEGDVLIVQKEFSPKSRIVLPSDTDDGNVVVIQKEFSPKSQIVLPNDISQGNSVAMERISPQKSSMIVLKDNNVNHGHAETTPEVKTSLKRFEIASPIVTTPRTSNRRHPAVAFKRASPRILFQKPSPIIKAENIPESCNTPVSLPRSPTALKRIVPIAKISPLANISKTFKKVKKKQVALKSTAAFPWKNTLENSVVSPPKVSPDKENFRPEVESIHESPSSNAISSNPGTPQSSQSSNHSDKSSSQVEEEWQRMIPELISILAACIIADKDKYFSTKISEYPKEFLPDYDKVIKRPMDFSTVRENLVYEKYKDSWDFLSDMTLVFHNARRYNNQRTDILDKVNKLEQLFSELIEELMQKFGYCCGKCERRVLYCQSKCFSIIGFREIYLISDTKCKYKVCQRCYSDTTVAEIKCYSHPRNIKQSASIRKNQFSEETNHCPEIEPLVPCLRCGKRYHSYCVLYVEGIWPKGFTCPSCLQKNKSPKPVNDFTAKNFPQTDLSNFLEERIKKFLEEKNVFDCEVIIRVTSISNRMVEVKPQMKNLFEEKGVFPNGLPYSAKSIFAFKVIDAVEVMFFGMCIQEYGTDCPGPNSRCIYLSYLDSVHYFQPKEFRTSVYQEIILGYFEYVKKLGFAEVHIWSSPPPSKTADYLFLHHPPGQKIPDAVRLIKWYKSLISRGIECGIIKECQDLLSAMKNRKVNDVISVVYFDGDYWPADVLEEEIGKMQTAKSKAPRSPAKKPFSLLDRFYTRLKKERDALFVIHLQPIDKAKTIILNPNREIQGCFMDTRKEFYEYSKIENYNFSTLRNAKFSTMAIMFRVWVGVECDITCCSCSQTIEPGLRYLCTNIACFPFDMCPKCYRETGHPHKLFAYLKNQSALTHN